MKVVYRRDSGDHLTEKQIQDLKELANLPDHEIDTSDIPEWTEEQWINAVRGRFYRASEAGGESAAGRGCHCVAEEGWAGISDAGESDSSGEDVGGVEVVLIC